MPATAISFLILATCSTVCITCRAATPPGQVFDLSSFTLQIPEKNKHGITEIKQPQLAQYSSKYFSTDPSDNGAVFWAPSGGATTGNGAGPRTELTENHEFTYSGIHEMNITQQVLQVPKSGKICIGQIKGDSYKPPVNNHCLIGVEFMYNYHKKQVEAHMRDRHCKSVTFPAGHYELGEKIEIAFRVDGFNVIVNTNKALGTPYSYDFMRGKNYQMHFKVGDYTQGRGGSSQDGGKTKLSALNVRHSS